MNAYIIEARTPTYRTAARVLERKNGEGARLVGWTLLRSALILPGFMLVDVPLERALVGALASSVLITALAVCWINGEARTT